MGYALKQSSTQAALLFLLVSATDHITPATGLTPTVTIRKSGGSFASPTGAVTEIANGWYQVAGNATDSATLGPLALHVASSGSNDPCDDMFYVVAYDPHDAVRQGLTALPNAAAGASGGLPLSVDASGRVDVLKINGTSQTARDIGASVLLSSGTGTGQLSLSSGTVTVGTNNDKTGYSLSQAFPTNFSSLSIDASGRVDIGKTLGTAITLDANNVINVSTKYMGGTLLTARDIGLSVLLSNGTGTGQLKLASGYVAMTWADIAAPTTTVSLSGTTIANLTNAPTAGDFTATMKTSLNAATPALSTAGNNAVADAFLDRNMATGTDSGSSTIRTPRQALRLLRNAWAILAGNLTVYKEDDTTSSWTAAVTGTAGADPITSTDPAG